MEPNVKVFNHGNYSAIAKKRERLNSFPTKPYHVLIIKATPKGKYRTEKTLYNYVYATMEDAITYAEKYITEVERVSKKREEEKEKKRLLNADVKASDFYKVGDIVVNTWGWEQTNVDFYEVVEVKNKTILINEIGGMVEEGSEYSHGMACNVLPVKGNFIVGGDSYKLRVKNGGTLSNPASYYYMHKWDGRPEYKSWYA
jgi:hypothetical protein